MRVAALYDIHGNLPALEAVLAELRALAVEMVVVGGDVLPGPMPAESLASVGSLDVPTHCIRGNGDRVVLETARGIEPLSVPEPSRDAVRWCARQLDATHGERISGWPDTLRIDLPVFGEVLFCHATPRSDTEIFTRDTPDERLRRVVEPADVRLVVCGHTHMQFDRTVGRTRVVNAGSVGMPFGEPGAYWLLLDGGIELRRTSYDLDRAAERVLATGYPDRERFAREIAQPRSAREMLEAFAGVELE